MRLKLATLAHVLSMLTAAASFSRICLSAQVPPEFAPIMAAHTTTIDSLRALDAKIAFYTDENGKPPAIEPGTTWRWSKQGELERVRSVYHNAPLKRGLPNNLTDVFLDGTNAKLLSNWSKTAPQQITPANQGTVRAWIEPQTGRIPGNQNASTMLLFHFQLSPEDDRRTLSELVAIAARVDVHPPSAADKQAIWHIRCWHPGLAGQFRGSYIDVFLDPSIGYLARRSVEHMSSVPGPGGSTIETEIVREVLEANSYDNGVFFPRRIRQHYQYFDSDGLHPPLAETRVLVDDVIVNDVLQSDALDFVFPEFCLVKYLPPKSGRVKVDLWGPDNQPLVAVNSAADIMRYEPVGEMETRPSIRLPISLAGTVLAIGIGWYLLARRQRTT